MKCLAKEGDTNIGCKGLAQDEMQSLRDQEIEKISQQVYKWEGSYGLNPQERWHSKKGKRKRRLQMTLRRNGQRRRGKSVRHGVKKPKKQQWEKETVVKYVICCWEFSRQTLKSIHNNTEWTPTNRGPSASHIGWKSKYLALLSRVLGKGGPQKRGRTLHNICLHPRPSNSVPFFEASLTASIVPLRKSVYHRSFSSLIACRESLQFGSTSWNFACDHLRQHRESAKNSAQHTANAY